MKLIVCIYFWIWIVFINVLVYYEDKKVIILLFVWKFSKMFSNELKVVIDFYFLINV